MFQVHELNVLEENVNKMQYEMCFRHYVQTMGVKFADPIRYNVGSRDAQEKKVWHRRGT